MGLQLNLILNPGARAPGFMLPPASQAQNSLLVQSHDDPQIEARQIELLIGVSRVPFEVISMRRKIILS